MKTTWNLDLLYTSGKDPQIEKDLLGYEKLCATFEKKYKKDVSYLDNPESLLKALKDYEKFYEDATASKAYAYFNYRKDLNSTDQEAEAESNKISQRLAKSSNKTLFFEIELGKISKDRQKAILTNPEFSKYKYFLERIFITAKYNLTEAEEKIMNLKSLPARGMWVDSQEKLLNQQSVTYKGQQIALPGAQNMLTELPTKERRMLADKVNEVLKSISHFAEAELNAILTDKKINDELRGLANPYSATIIGYQNDEKAIINFVQTVTQYFSISHRFYKVKAKLLKEEKLEYADRAAKVGTLKLKLSFEESLEILRKAFGKVNPEYVTILNRYVEQGQIDVFPRVGKRGGAYCSSNVGLPTFVMLNHVDNLKSLKTFAHEMGHAIHAEYSKTQPALYQGHTISVAEVASTLFENFVFEEVFETLTAKEKIIALHDTINDSISTIFRQIGGFNFELDLHTTLREKGALSKEEIAELHNKNMKAYLGPQFEMKENDGYFFVNWPHIRYFFYVYSYAYGELISRALYENYKKDPAYIKKIEEFLKAGGSKSPEKIFKDIGIDTSKPQFFIDGLKSIEEDIKKLEELTA
ncbi:MAG: M3 family oligoendopeptidase [Patescibacteria group bacterium]